MVIGVCTKCGYQDLIDESIENICPRCSGSIVSLGIKSDVWNSLSNEDKQSLTNEIIEKHKPIVDTSVKEATETPPEKPSDDSLNKPISQTNIAPVKDTNTVYKRNTKSVTAYSNEQVSEKTTTNAKPSHKISKKWIVAISLSAFLIISIGGVILYKTIIKPAQELAQQAREEAQLNDSLSKVKQSIESGDYDSAWSLLFQAKMDHNDADLREYYDLLGKACAKKAIRSDGINKDEYLMAKDCFGLSKTMTASHYSAYFAVVEKYFYYPFDYGDMKKRLGSFSDIDSSKVLKKKLDGWGELVSGNYKNKKYFLTIKEDGTASLDYAGYTFDSYSLFMDCQDGEPIPFGVGNSSAVDKFKFKPNYETFSDNELSEYNIFYAFDVLIDEDGNELKRVRGR